VARAQAMRAELQKSIDSFGDKVKAHPTVVKAFETYDAQVEALQKVTNSEAAKRIFELLAAAKAGLVKVRLSAFGFGARGQC